MQTLEMFSCIVLYFVRRGVGVVVCSPAHLTSDVSMAAAFYAIRSANNKGHLDRPTRACCASKYHSAASLSSSAWEQALFFTHLPPARVDDLSLLASTSPYVHLIKDKQSQTQTTSPTGQCNTGRTCTPLNDYYEILRG